MDLNPALQRRLKGNQDPKGVQGILSRGANVYNGGSASAHSGGGIDYPPGRQSPMMGQMGQMGQQQGVNPMKIPTEPQMQPRPMGMGQAGGVTQLPQMGGAPGAPPQGYNPQQAGQQGIQRLQEALSNPQIARFMPPEIMQLLQRIAARRLEGPSQAPPTDQLEGPQQPPGQMNWQSGGAEGGRSPLPPPVGPQSMLAAARLARLIRG